jgi:hypothetical protein
LDLVRDLNNVHDGVFGEYVGQIVPGLCFCLTDKLSSTNVIIDTLVRPDPPENNNNNNNKKQTRSNTKRKKVTKDNGKPKLFSCWA